MRRNVFAALALLALAAAPADAAVPVSLKGSPQSMVRQNEAAKAQELAFVQLPAELWSLERSGELVRVEGNDDFEVADFVSHPLARPELRTFIERLAAEYHAATGEKLVVTSLVRPASRQPGNAHELSVHPAGVAVDLRVSQRAESRKWLEDTLLEMEGQGLLDVTREKSPPHYHVALFPQAYVAWAEALPDAGAGDAREAPRSSETSAASGDAARGQAEGGDGSGGRRVPAGVWMILMAMPMVSMTRTVLRRGR